MRLTMKERHSLVKVTAERYQGSGKGEKRVILDEFVKATGYHRTYASYLLSRHGKKVRTGGKKVYVGDIAKRVRKRRGRIYGPEEVEALKVIWKVADCICGKRLVATIPEMVAKLCQFSEWKASRETCEKLFGMSAATIDRLLAGERKKAELKARSQTKPGTLLKHQIPIRTFSDWDDAKPGFVEIDLVAHNGGDARGDFCQTLSLTDVASGWCEAFAVKNKAQVWVFEGIRKVRKRLPFALLGIDSDNGGEFINDQLTRYCELEKITFTRSRPYQKNDNCYVEQKNYTIVRRAVGYMRHDTDKELDLLNRLYSVLRLYNNFFIPSVKLVGKTRIGSKVTKRYDDPQTPFVRLTNSADVTKKIKDRLAAEYAMLNPAQLKREITRLQKILMRENTLKRRNAPPQPLHVNPSRADPQPAFFEA